MTAEIKTNLPQFSAALRAMGRDMEKKAVRQATGAAAAILRNAARARAPILKTLAKNRTTGALRRSVRYARSRYQVGGAYRAFVGVKAGKAARKTSADPFYWKFLEGGWIPSGRRKRKGGERSRALQRRRALEGGGQRISYPFLEPAFNSHKTIALNRFYARISQAIAEYNRIRTK